MNRSHWGTVHTDIPMHTVQKLERAKTFMVFSG